jgi:hypothetical protein
LRESLERERERADAEWENAEALQLELELLREQLAEASIPQKPLRILQERPLLESAVPSVSAIARRVRD